MSKYNFENLNNGEVLNRLRKGLSDVPQFPLNKTNLSLVLKYSEMVEKLEIIVNDDLGDELYNPSEHEELLSEIEYLECKLENERIETFNGRKKIKIIRKDFDDKAMFLVRQTDKPKLWDMYNENMESMHFWWKESQILSRIASGRWKVDQSK